MKSRGKDIEKQLKDLPCLLVWLCWLYTFHLFCEGEISKRIKRAILPLLILSVSLSLFYITLSDGHTHICRLAQASHTHETESVEFGGMHLEIVCMQLHNEYIRTAIERYFHS